MSNAKALAIVQGLLEENKISISDAVEIAEAIPAAEDTADATRIRDYIRTRIEAVSDFGGIVFKGRPHAPTVKGSDIITDSLTVRELEALLRSYWKGRKRNNAEMGRLMAVFEAEGYIQVPSGGIGAAATYFISRLNYITGWDVRQIVRGYSAVRNLWTAAFDRAVLKERLRLENCLQGIKSR